MDALTTELLTQSLYDRRGFSRQFITDEPLYYPIVTMLYLNSGAPRFAAFIDRLAFPNGTSCLIEQIICQECARAADDPATDAALFRTRMEEVLRRYVEVALREYLDPALLPAWPRKFGIQSVEVAIADGTGQIRVFLKSSHDGLPRQTSCCMARQCERGQLLKVAVYQLLFVRIPNLLTNLQKKRREFHLAEEDLRDTMRRFGVDAGQLQFVHRVYTKFVESGTGKRAYPIYVCVAMFCDGGKVFPVVATSGMHPLSAECDAMALLSSHIQVVCSFEDVRQLDAVPQDERECRLQDRPSFYKVWREMVESNTAGRVHLTVGYCCHHGKWTTIATVYREKRLPRMPSDKYRAAKDRCAKQLEGDMYWRMEQWMAADKKGGKKSCIQE